VSVVTYIDSGVLIAAARAEKDELAATATSFLNDPLREYVTSHFVRLEVLPKAKYHSETAEVTFYETFFANSYERIEPSKALLEFALKHACATGISGIDALHIACAVFSNAEELITAEKRTKPIHRTKLIKVVSIVA
jgi:predicted nucleic acid-binding protein